MSSQTTASDHAGPSAEFRRSARNAAEYEQMSTMFGELYPDVSLPKGTWQWVEFSQHRLVLAGAHRAGIELS
jgi:hypothetical protein